MEIISISGLDGSGKSTQIQALKEHFESTGKKVYYFHAVNFSIANILNVFSKEKSGTKASKNVTKASWSAIQLRKIAMFIDVLFFIIFTKKLSTEKYDYLLTDRYFYDMIVNISYLAKKQYKPFFFRLIARPDVKLLLSVAPDVIMQRDDPPSQGIDYLKEKEVLFQSCQEKFDLIEIDGNRSKEEIFAEIKSLCNPETSADESESQDNTIIQDSGSSPE